MTGIIEIASSVLSQSGYRVETAAQNLANINTRGYKRRVDFSQLLSSAGGLAEQVPTLESAIDLSPGKQILTDNPYDLSIGGPGFFVVRSPDGLHYTRNGQFHRDAEDRLVTAQGSILQAQGGGDLILHRPGFDLSVDGAVIEDGAAIARLAVVDFENPTVLRQGINGAFDAPGGVARDVDAPPIKQRFVESANVSTGDEMVSMMAALRHAESGQRLAQLYDDLMGRAITAFAVVPA